MPKKILIVAIVISLILGIILGYFLGLKKSKQIIPEKTQVELQENLLPTLSRLKMIHDWTATASGKITKISGRVLTLVADGDNLEIPIIEGAKIILFIPSVHGGGGEKEAPKEIEFKDLKIGNRVDVLITIKDSELKGFHIIVFPE